MKQHLGVFAAALLAIGVGGGAAIAAPPGHAQSGVKAEKQAVKQDIKNDKRDVKQDKAEAKAIGKGHKKVK